MKKHLIVCTAIFAAMTGGCNKYEDGPAISLRSKKKRIANTWRIEKYYVNDVEQTTAVALLGDYTVTFTKDGNYSFNTTFIDGSGTREFINDKEGIRIIVPNNLSGQDVNDFTILRLKEKEFWYYYTEGSDKHEIHLKPD